MKKTLTWGMLALLVAGPASADEIDDRVRSIEDNLGRIKDKLDGIVSDSSSSDIDSALDYLNNVKSDVDRLKSLDPQNDPAKTMANYYPDYISKFRESAQYLKRMKDAQVKADESRLHERCQEADKNLKSFMQGFIEKKDPNGVSKISDEAEKVGRQYSDEYKRLQDMHSDMDRARGYARYFSESHGRWSDVRGELYDGVSDIWDRWTRRMEETKSKCQELAKGRDYDAVKDALAKLGDNNRVRKELTEKLNSLLDQTASYLSGAGTRTGTSEIDYAIRYSDDLLSQLEQLKNARGEDDTAKRMTDVWPDKTKELRRSLELLKQVKPQQFSFDTLATTCKTNDDQLMGTVRAYLGAPDDADEGVRVVTERSEKLGNDTRQQLEAAEKRLGEQDKLLEDSKRFSFDEGRWRSVRERLQETASVMQRHMKTKLDEAKAACGKLSQGASNPDVVSALKTLKDRDLMVKTSLERILRDYEDWKKDRKGLKPGGRFRQENAEKLLQAYCDGDEYQVADRLQRVADEVASVMGNLQRQYLDRLRRLMDDLKPLETTKNPTLKTEAARQRRNMSAAYKRLEEAGGLGILRGRNNPKINMLLENGNTKHLALQTGCTAMEYEIPGGRIDCVNVSDGFCEVIEIKPNSKTGRSAGEEQIANRKSVIEDMFRNNQLKSLLQRCVKDGRLNISYQVKYYQRCPVGMDDIDVTTEEMDE
ncbi:hypothetical protein JY651_50640 [Pyxidicoccus parkwayensis]|uniref:Uncharacterized protein n=1 Tax=Pyxidicoccus parkwayensis TaxID=2813578 RepID=A0ABX7NXQ9_9BACT|nr:hypothetical protein [Pyxidicoccus parkwaysis]QSQ23248.1 hypothetical protein JY651_50640 [Pyxidicoccus parkwaysis]